MKKMSKKSVIVMYLFFMLVGGSSVCGCQKQEAANTEGIKKEEVQAEETQTEELVLEENQSVVYGQIVSINGNEISYYPIEKGYGNGESMETEEKGKEAPEGFPGGGPPSRPGGSEKQTVTVQIPVGTKVTTRLGTETTFSRLAVGDNIKMLMEEEAGELIILEIWIVD